MRPARVAPLLVAGAAAGAAVAVLFLGAGGDDVETLPQLAGPAAVAHTALEPRAHLFGDVVFGRVEVLVDRGRADPAELRLDAGFEPYEPVGPVRTERRDAGGVTQLRFTVLLRCLAAECVPHAAREVFAFPPGAIVAGNRRIAEIEWPELEVTSRMPRSAAGEASPARSDWRANVTALPEPSYRLAPGTAAAALAALAGVLVAGAAALVVNAARRPERAAPRLPPLERALLLLAAARRRADPAEERRALDLLASELGRTGETELAQVASELAWARPGPGAEATELLSGRVEQLVARRRNGSGP